MANRRHRHRILPLMAAVAVGVGGLALAMLSPAIKEGSETAAFDQMQRLWPRAYQPAPVRVVDIDDESLQRIGQWPWARDEIAALTDRLTEMGAAAIAFDFLFAEPDRSSPAAILRDVPLAALLGQAGLLPDHDRIFAEAIARGPVVLPVGLVADQNSATPALKAAIATVGDDPLATAPHFNGAVPSLPILEEAARGIGTFSFAAGADNIVRSIPLVSTLNGAPVASLSVEALRVATGAGTLAVKRQSKPDDWRGERLAVKIGSQIVEAEGDARYRLHFTGHQPARMVPAWQILDPAASATAEVRDRIAGSIVLIGTSAVGLGDLRSTPVEAFLPGVEVHAEALEHMLLGIQLTRADWQAGAEVLAGVGLTIIVGVVAAFFGLPWIAGLVALMVAGGLAAAAFAFRDHGILIDPTFPVALPLLAGLSAAFARYGLVDRDGRRMKAAFAQYLSPALVDKLAADPGAIQLGGEMRQVSCIFTDLEGFTKFSERAAPETLVRVLNAYLGELCRIAKDEGGTVMKLIGDAVNVVFNAPLDQPDHAARAVRCALKMDIFARRFADEQRAAGIPFGVTRIGIATGPAVVGNFGGDTRFDYSAYGDTINTSARLEAANKTLGTRICVTASTAEAAGEAALFRPVGALTIRGKDIPVDAFEPMAADDANLARLTRHLAAIAAFARGDEAGRDAIAAYVADCPDDPIARLMARQLEEGRNPLAIAV